jgi:phage terminase large subunit-like protein
MVAYRVAWEITRNPAIRVLYISSTQNLATKQLTFIKDILTSPIYRYYWPDMVHPDEGKRAKWTESEISVDHPKRKAEIVRDPTVFTAGLTTSITGLHCDIAVLDDVVVRENAYTVESREKTRSQYSLLSSIEGIGAMEWVVGTRYHPKDLYNDMLTMAVEQYDDDGDIIGEEPLYETFERAVENRGDGTGEFLWPRQQRYDGKWFGFDRGELAKKRASYLDKIQYYAQYYNRPSTVENALIKRDWFQYYKQEHLVRQHGKWYYKDKRLNVFAAVDFAFSLSKKADYTSIVVVGIDADRNYYVLEIDRFRTDAISEYFQHILNLHQKWDFRKLRAEVTMAQQVIVNDLKHNYISPHGLSLAIEDYRPSRQQGSKEERVEALLQPRYANRQIWHYRGGNCQSLEDEISVTNPPHDDCKDALASVIEICVAPSKTFSNPTGIFETGYVGHHRFGGIL